MDDDVESGVDNDESDIPMILKNWLLQYVVESWEAKAVEAAAASVSRRKSGVCRTLSLPYNNAQYILTDEHAYSRKWD